MNRYESPLAARRSRRAVLKLGLAASVACLAPAWARAETMPRRLAFEHLHTGETLAVTYFRDGRYDRASLTAINELLRDFRTGDVHAIETALLDQLFSVHDAIGSDAPFRIISGYRSPATNDMLHRKSGGVAKRSLHMDGRAIDVRLTDTKTRTLRDVAARLGHGGVGYYASSDFVHLDTGRPRQW